MSSSYRRICLSHDPPLIIDEDMATGLADEMAPPKPPGHPGCVIGVGRWSGDLIEVWLPTPYSRRPEPGEDGDPLVRVAGKWFDVSWMRRFPWIARVMLDGW